MEIDKFVHRFYLETTNFASFQSKKKNDLHGNQSILTKIVNLNYRQIHHLYKNQFYVENKCVIIESKYDV